LKTTQSKCQDWEIKNNDTLPLVSQPGRGNRLRTGAVLVQI
jgi:hypothetical protein